jgi:hypothetical protein
MIERIFKSIRLDRAFYQEAANDPSLNIESTLTVIAVTLISSIGVLTSQGGSWLAYLGTAANGLILGWLLWAVIAWFIGKNVLDGEGSLSGMLRGLGYASAPRLLGIFSGLPIIGWIFNLAGGIMSLIAGIIAIREGMSVDTGKAIIIALLGGLFYIAVSILIGVLSLPLKLVF